MDEPATGEKLEQSCVIPLGPVGFPELPSAPLSESFLWPNSHAFSDYETASTSLAQGDSPKSTPRCDDWADSSPSSAMDPVSSASCSPSTWTQHHTTDGYVYFVHDATGESSWVLPEGDVLSASSHCATLECHQSSAVPDNSVATAHVCEPADYTAVVPVLQADMQGRLFYLYETTGDWHYAADADWVAGVDPSSGVTYFWNQVTYESSWYHPMRVVPAAAPASLTTFGHSPLPSSTCRARAAPVRVRSSRTTARSDSDSDTTCEDSDSGNSGDDEDEVLHELEGVDGAVVGLTLRQRVKWTKALVRRLSGSAVENAVAIASRLSSSIAYHASPILGKAMPALQAAKSSLVSMAIRKHDVLPVRAPVHDARVFVDPDAAVYHAMHSSPKRSQRAPALRSGGATAPRTPRLVASQPAVAVPVAPPGPHPRIISALPPRPPLN